MCAGGQRGCATLRRPTATTWDAAAPAEARWSRPAAANTLPKPQALCFLESGRTFVPAKPWAPAEESKWVADARLLPPLVVLLVQRFKAQAAEGSGGGSEAAEGSGGGSEAAAAS